jgi:Lectin C-type domain
LGGTLRFRYLLVVGLLFLMTHSRCNGTIIAGPIVNPLDNNTYYLTSSDTWTASETTAVSLGGQLATVTSAADDTWILNTFSPYSGTTISLWIGLYDPTGAASNDSGSQHANNFIWSSGQSSAYRNWASGEPNDDSVWGGEYYTALFLQTYRSVLPGQWNDQNNTSSGLSDFGLVEVVPEPDSLMFVAVVPLILIRRHRFSFRK